jgi:putative addiction module CopG family antidote
MAKTTSFALSAELERFLRHEVAEGHYSSASEVVREALYRMMEHKRKRRELECLLDEGIKSAESESLLTRDQVFRLLDGKAQRKPKARKPR